MPSPPWMPLYVGDYLRDTQHLTTEEHGAYLLLLMHYWTHGSLSADPKELAAISKLTSAKWQKISPTIQRFFEIREENFWHHGRATEELRKSREKYEKKRMAASLGGIEKARRISAIRQLSAVPPAMPSAEQQKPFGTANHNHNHIKEEEKNNKGGRLKKEPSIPPVEMADENYQFARDCGWQDARIISEYAHFCDYCRSHGKTYKDINAAWRNWVRSPLQEKATGNGRSHGSEKGNSVVEAGRRLLAGLGERQPSFEGIDPSRDPAVLTIPEDGCL